MFISRNTLCILALAVVASEIAAEDFKCPTGAYANYIPNYADVDNCKMFYNCGENGAVNHWECGEGEVFDPNSRYCAKDTECRPQYKFQCNDDLMKASQYHVDKENCRKFYFCGNRGQTFLWGCGGAQVFNPNTRLCTAGTECLKLTNPDNFCPTDLNGQKFFRDPKDCRKFFYCSAGGAIKELNDCPNQEVFDPIQGFCVPAELAPKACSKPTKKCIPKRRS